MSDIYEFKMSLFDMFDKGKPEEVFLFLRNFYITLVAPGTLEMGAKVQYLCILVHGESLHQLDLLFFDTEIIDPLTRE